MLSILCLFEHNILRIKKFILCIYCAVENTFIQITLQVSKIAGEIDTSYEFNTIIIYRKIHILFVLFTILV